MTSTSAFRGSRKHVLDWTARPDFLREFSGMLALTEVDLGATVYMPAGPSDPREARLETFGPRVLPAVEVWPALHQWWLKHPRGANTPNWDLALGARIEGRPGLVLVEAKANVRELSDAGKAAPTEGSDNSAENHTHIGKAIAQANAGWMRLAPAARLSRDSHYQLSNRLAFTWKLATSGLPIVLVYLGFTGDGGIADAGEPLRDDAHWRAVLRRHAEGVGMAGVWEKRLDFGAAPAWVLCRSRPVIETSSPAAGAQAMRRRAGPN